MKEKIIFSWSSGKDSAFALWWILKNTDYQIDSLFTTVSSEYGRVGLHGVPLEFLQKQAESIEIPLNTAFISNSESVEDYAEKLKKSILEIKANDVNKIVYGDIFLENLKKFRLEILSDIDMEGIFPLWGKDTKKLAKDIVNAGFKAIITSVNSDVLDETYLGRVIDEHLLDNLPEGIDCCGENGEFHTFVFDGPIFKNKINLLKGEVVFRDGYYYCDLTTDILNKTNLEKINLLAPNMRNEIIKLAKICDEEGILFEIVSSKRSFEQQQEIIKEYGEKYVLEKACEQGESCHEKGLAVDIKIGNSLSFVEEYAVVGKIWENMGHVWLGNDDIKAYWHLGY